MKMKCESCSSKNLHCYTCNGIQYFKCLDCNYEWSYYEDWDPI